MFVCADVVNCMQTDDMELKKLVYLYLINYAKTQPDLAIMAVNTFVKVLASRWDQQGHAVWLFRLMQEQRAVAVLGVACLNIRPVVAHTFESGMLFPQDTQDPNPLIRALAVRTMGCIRVDKITEYLCDPLQRCLRDDDPYVRKTAAVCVAKLYDINPELVEDRGFLDSLKVGWGLASLFLLSCMSQRAQQPAPSASPLVHPAAGFDRGRQPYGGS